jgi:type IV pilus assembly protein PilE
MQPVLNIRGRTSRRAAGFTLIELMITITILAIIVGLAVPAYNDYVRKARRAEAVSTIMSAAQYLERCFTQNNDYTACDAPVGDTQDGYYAITVPEFESASFRIEAAPQNAQLNDPCGTYRLDNLGQKSNVNTKTGAVRCWGSN